MKSNRAISSLIRSHIKAKNFDYLETSLALGYEKLPRTVYYRRLLKKGFLLLSKYYLDKDDLFGSLSNIEYARKLISNNLAVVKREFQLLERIFDRYYPDFVNRDIQLLRGIIKIFLTYYRERYPNLVRILESIDRRFRSLSQNVKDGKEGKFTYRIEKFFCNLYDDLTPEEQADLFADIIAPEILREIGEELEEERENEIDKEEST